MSIFRNAQQKIAHTSTVPSLGNKEFRNLQDVISTEKDFVKSNTKATSDWKKNSDALKTWGEAEGEDLNDILSKLSLLFSHYETSQNRFNSHLSTIRLHFKSLRTREESLSDLKSRKRSLGSKIETVEKKLAKMGPENKELMKTTSTLKEYRSEMEGMIIEVRNEEAAIGDFKRRTTKDAMGLKCGGLLEMAEKMTIVAEIGKLMVEEIPLDITEPGMPRRQYDGFSKTEQLLSEATRCIADVGFAPTSAGGFAQTSSGGVGTAFGGHHRNETSLNGIGEEGEILNRGQDGYPINSSDPNQHYDDPNPNQEIGDTNGFTSTPIYANNQSTFRTGQWAESQQSYDREGGAAGENGTVGNGSRLSTEGYRDTAADEWGRSAGAAIAGAAATGTEEPDRETQAAQEAYRSTDQDVENEYSGKQTSENNHKEESVNASHNKSYQLEDGPAPSASASTNSHTYGIVPKSRENSNEPPTLPPISTSTPLPTGTSPSGGMTPVSPSAAEAQDDATYFASIGSTRAAQAAVRRPNSPPANSSSRYSGVPTVAVSQPALASASIQKVYEPATEGKKMTAAAFRKGFNRVPSNQNVNPGGITSLGNVGNSMGKQSNNPVTGEEVGNESNSSVPPLAIKKRNSYQPQEHIDGVDDAAPPYMPGGPSHGTQGPAPSPIVDNSSNLNINSNSEEPRSSVYGGMNDYNNENSRRQSYQSAQTSQTNQYSYNDPYTNPNSPQPPIQPWTQGGNSRPNSRPGSAQGSRPLPNQSNNGYYPSYPTSGY